MSTSIAIANHECEPRHIGLARSNLSRFDINVIVPTALAMLVIDLFERLPHPEEMRFRSRLAATLTPGVDLCLVPPQFLQWLLTDMVHGLARLPQRVDVKEAVERVARDVIAPQAIGDAVPPTALKTALFMAEVAQANAWDAYRHASRTPHQARIDWMVAAAAADAVKPQLACTLTGAMQSAAVAWSAAGAASVDFYRAAVEKLLKLIREQNGSSPQSQPPGNSPIAPGDRVRFDDAHDGPQTGTVIGLTAGANALVEVDHNLDGIVWNVPIGNLTPAGRVPG